MRRHLRLLVTAAALLAGCGGSSSGESGFQACSAGARYQGAPLHGPLPASAFPPFAPAAPSITPMPQELRAELESRVELLLQQTGAPAIAAAIEAPGYGRWSATRGLARVAPAQAATAQTWFYWGSIAKPLTAVLVLQLVEEGRLQVGDRLSNWYSGLPPGRQRR